MILQLHENIIRPLENLLLGDSYQYNILNDSNRYLMIHLTAKLNLDFLLIYIVIVVHQIIKCLKN